MPQSKEPKKKKISCALQGGGSHGAFTWGVMDRLLEDGRFEFEGLSGTSAGGMNAVAIVQGLMRGGPEQAREELRNFWTKISESGKNSAMKPGPLDKMQGKYTMSNSPGFMMFDFMTKLFSPYEFNPKNINPLKDVVQELFDFENIRKFKESKVFLCATHVYTGKLKVFSSEELKPECVLASACLPFLHQAVEVDGEYYWDGGFIGNPVLFPLIYECKTPDIVVIQLNPTHRPHLPTTSRDISDRLNEITCNASLVREMRSIAFISKLIDDGLLDSKAVKRLHIHLIRNEEVFQELGFSSKLNSDWDFLTHLFNTGRETADAWIKKNYDNVGVKTTADILDDYVNV
jgi:NTE family protein